MVFVTGIASGQETDSLIRVLNNTQDEYDRMVLCIDIAFAYENIDYEEGRKYIGEALDLAQKTNNEYYTGQVWSFLTNYYAMSENYPEALSYGKKSVEIFVRLDSLDDAATLYNNLGYISDNIGDYKKALEYYYKALKMHEKHSLETEIVSTLINIGLVQLNLGDTVKSVDYHLQALDLARKNNMQDVVPTIYNNMGMIYGDIDHEKAIVYLLNAAKGYKDNGDKDGIATAYSNLAMQYYTLELYDSAYYYFVRSGEIFKEIDRKYGLSWVCNSLGCYHLEMKNFHEALAKFIEGMKIAREYGYENILLNQYSGIIDAYDSLGNYTKRLEYLKKYELLYDSLFNSDNMAVINSLNIKYETEKKEQQLAESKKLLKISRENTIRKKQQKLYFLIIIVLIIPLGILVFFSNKRKKKDNILLQEKNDHINLQKEEIRAQRDMIAGQRDMISRQKNEITDSIRYASRIQAALIPSDAILSENLPGHFILYNPREIISGDFYWTGKIDGKIIIIAADCIQHGVPGAFISMLGITVLNEIVHDNRISEPGRILSEMQGKMSGSMNQHGISGNKHTGMNISIVTVNTTANTLEFAGAGHSIYRVREGELTEMQGTDQTIGFSEEMLSPEKQQMQLEKNDMVYVFTDGFINQFGGESGKKFRMESFRDLLKSLSHKALIEQKILLERSFEEWKGKYDQVDDVLVLGIKI